MPLAGPAVVSALAILSFLINGYHPWAEDGGVYAAGVKRLLAPQLYPHQTAFVTEHLRFSLYAPFIAALTRTAHLPLTWVLFLLYTASIWLTLYAAWMLAGRCFTSLEARAGAVTLLACWLDLPLAGTSLMLMDPYLTARSLSTPLTLFGLCWALDALDLPGRRATRWSWLKCVLAFVAALALHPLMAGYGILAVVALIAMSASTPIRRLLAGTALCCTGLLAGLAVQTLSPPESPDYLRVVLTRQYWFPATWQWYEVVGILAPLALLAAILRWQNRAADLPAYRRLARMAITLALVAIVIAVLYARINLTPHTVARLQPLRTLQTVYSVMIVLLGGAIAEYLLRRKPLRWIALLALAGIPMFLAQRATFPSSQHIELPGSAPSNQWVQSFHWISRNTPPSDLFAMDPHYTTLDGEDAQGFRAIAERSALPDYAKDGGETSITPELTPAWIAAQQAQAQLNTETDADRIAHLAPLGVDWLILPVTSTTQLFCPYRNRQVQVCRLH
jgi:hypothetical protein